MFLVKMKTARSRSSRASRPSARVRSGACRAPRSQHRRRRDQGLREEARDHGVGYRAALQGKNLQLALGYSHDVDLRDPGRHHDHRAPKPTEITISGIDKQQVGQVAAEIREYAVPEPYKGKGVKYAGEKIFRKEGKKK
jgi:large subunit ribosomal protein L6